MKDLTGQEMPPETVAYLKSHTLSVLFVCAVGLAARYGVLAWAWDHADGILGGLLGYTIVMVTWKRSRKAA